MSTEQGPYAYYVPQTPHDSSRRNSFFRRSSPTTLTRLISSVNKGISSIRNIGHNQERNHEDPPLQHRVNTLETTLQSVHATVSTLEHTMNDIVALLCAPPPPASTEKLPTAAEVHMPTSTPPVSSPRVSAITHDNGFSPVTPTSYCDTARQKAPPIVTTIIAVSPADPPIPIRALRPNGSTRFQDDFDDAKSPLVQWQRRRQDYISGHYCWPSINMTFMKGRNTPDFK
jgi:hypothetical protein